MASSENPEIETEREASAAAAAPSKAVSAAAVSVEVDALRVGRAAARVVIERPDAERGARRDVHRKHHGLLRGMLEVDSNIPAPLRRGVFAAGGKYKVWIRFSSSSKRAQTDTAADGRGIALKLLDVQGKADAFLADGEGKDQHAQDFLFLNGPAFFASDAKSMVTAAELEADDKFPSNFFLTAGNLRGFAALLRIGRAQAESVLDLEYYSQTPYRLGLDDAAPSAVKYRLRPLHLPSPRREGVKGANYLFEALRRDLDPASSRLPAVFELAVQLQGEDRALFPDDDATVVWDETLSPFIPIAQLIIPRQRFATQARMELAENISFNPWNGLSEHLPVGSINRARLHAYQGSKGARYRLNGVEPPDYSVGAWDEAAKKEASDPEWSPPLISSDNLKVAATGVATLLPWLGRGLVKVLSSYAVPAGLLAVLVGVGQCQSYRGDVPWYCGPLRLGGAALMPSEDAIPEAQYAPRWRGTHFESDRSFRESDPKWVFRYAPVGAEGAGGTPYWIFRALPHLFPEYFDGRTDWSGVGLQLKDDEEYYTDYHGLPRGLVLTEPVANIGGNELGLGLKLVTFNCATCHRGEFTNAQGKPEFVDGMPNLTFDAAKYKSIVFRCLRDPKFTVENLTKEIDRLLAQEHAAHPTTPSGKPTPTALTAVEHYLYALIVAQAKNSAWQKPLAWMDSRPQNGPGRLDAFGALRYEFLGFENEPAHIATVDLPSIWHQQTEWRPWHHYDGNTSEVRARNFGAIVGIGGTPETLRKATLLRVGDWIDQKIQPALAPPPYPFARAPAELVKAGRQLFENATLVVAAPSATCASCHGTYDDQGKLSQPTDCMRNGTTQMGTDAFRYQAIDAEFVKRLNHFGSESLLWGPEAFRPATGYTCPPLDGIWARAPYLHNGSVPTLWALLGRADQRPTEFFRGNPGYDTVKGGFIGAPSADRPTFKFDTLARGNGNAGHEIALGDSAEDNSKRTALIAYLLTL